MNISESVESNLKLFISPEQVTEIRVLSFDGSKPSSGYYDGRNLDKAAKDALYYSGRSAGVYFVPNCLATEVLTRRSNFIAEGRPKKGGMAVDADVTFRKFMMIDIDPLRTPGHKNDSATEEEKEHAFELLSKIRPVIISQGWLEPLVVDSGNGFHLYFRTSPNDTQLNHIPHVLQLLAAIYDTDSHRAKIDSSIGNPARIMRIPGTQSCKGTQTQDRPWRMAKVLSVPDTWSEVPTVKVGESLVGGLIAKLREMCPAGPLPTTTQKTVNHMGARTFSAYTSHYGAKALMDECNKLASTTSERNIALHQATCNIFELVYGGQIDPNEAENLLVQAAELCGLESTEITKTMNSAKKKVMDKPRTAPVTETIIEGDGPVIQIIRTPTTIAGEAGEVLASQIVDPAKPVAPIPFISPFPTDVPFTGPPQLRNYCPRQDAEGNQMDVGRPLKEITDEIFLKTKGWPKRNGNQLFYEKLTSDGPTVEFLTNPTKLFVYLGTIYGKTAGEGIPEIDWKTSSDKPSRDDLFESLLSRAESYSSIELYPHEPRLPDVWYCHRELPKDANGDDLNRLVGMFNPATPVDQELIRAAILTLYWGGPPGQRPGWLVTTSDGKDGRGYGKTTLVQHIASLVGGDVSINPNGKREVSTILLAPDAITKRVALVDNLKTRHFSNAEIEAAITGTKIDGNKLYDGYGFRPNLLTWFITVNGADLSKDLAQRLIPIYLEKPAYSPGWLDDLTNFIKARKWHIAADACVELAAASTTMTGAMSRHGSWENSVLGKLPNAEHLAQVIAARKESTDGDQEELIDVEAAISNAIQEKGLDPETDQVWISSSDLFEIVKGLSPYTNQRASIKWLFGMSSQKLTKCKSHRHRGAIWNADLSDKAKLSKKFDDPYSSCNYR